MKATIKRIYEPKQTLGDFEFQGFKCKTIELAWLDNQRKISCIPEGVYECTKELHAKFSKVFRVHDVEGRDGILIHYGNYAGSFNPKTGKPDSLGCILPGKSHTDIDGDGIRDITASRQMMDDLYRLMPDKFTLEIFS